MVKRRRSVAAALVCAAVGGATIVGSATPAAADTRISHPTDGAVIRDASVTIRADADTFAGRLLLNGTKVAEARGALHHRIDAHAVRNGGYTAVLEQRGLTGLLWYRRDQVDFTLRVAPRTPADARVDVDGRKVTLRWSRGAEPDLQGYEITSANETKRGSNGEKRVVEKDTAGALCSGSTCSTSVTVPSSVTGTITYSVRARRADGAGGSLLSDPARLTVAFPGEGGPGAVAGSEQAARGSAAAGAGGLDGRTGTPSLSLPRVPPGGAPGPFPYPTPDPEVAAPPGISPDAASGDSPQLALSLATALVILLGFTHVGMWMRRRRLAVAAAPVGRHRRAAEATGGAVAREDADAGDESHAEGSAAKSAAKRASRRSLSRATGAPAT